MALEMGPAKFIVSTFAETLPVAPGLTTLSNSATVHPQAGRAAMISRSAVPVFLITNDQSSFSPLATVPKSLIGSTTVRRGAFSFATSALADVDFFVFAVDLVAAPAIGLNTATRATNVMVMSRLDITQFLLLRT